MKHILQPVLLVITAMALFSIRSDAAVPQLINYQGRLTDNGTPVSGKHSLKFIIFTDEAGTIALWQETQPAVVVTDGLFQVLLGSAVPIPSSVFSGDRRWLGIYLDGGPVMTPLSPIVSTAYAFRAARADAADNALVGGGWYDDGTTIILQTSSDKVGIGNADPESKLDVAGSIRASDSLIGNQVRVGSPSQIGKLKLYGSSTSNTLMATADNGYRGIFLECRDYDGLVTHQMVADPDGGGGGLLWVGRGSNVAGFNVDGNHSGTGNAFVGIYGASRNTFFDMNESGDSSVMLPSSSISDLETSNEAGIASTRRTTVVNLTDTLVTVASRMVRFPSDGYALVIASGSVSIQHTFEDTITFGVSNSQTSFPVGANVLRLPDALPNGNYQQPLMAQGYFSVDAGIQTFYLLVKRPLHNGNCSVSNANLAVMYFPTNYLYIIPPAATAGNGIDAEQLEMDQLIEQKITEREQAMREEFDAKLKAIQEEMKKQIDRGDK